MSSLLYSACEHVPPNAGVKNQDWFSCLNEGLYYCRLCTKKYCEDHLCSHLASQFDESSSKTARPTLVQQASVDATLFGMEDDTRERGFIAYTEDELRTIPEMRLRGRQNRLFAELKRISRELERRMVYNAEMQGIKRRSPVMPGNGFTVPAGQSGFVKDVQAQARKDAKSASQEKARQTKIQDALTLLAKLVADGSVNKTQLNSQVRKVK